MVTVYFMSRKKISGKNVLFARSSMVNVYHIIIGCYMIFVMLHVLYVTTKINKKGHEIGVMHT